MWLYHDYDPIMKDFGCVVTLFQAKCPSRSFRFAEVLLAVTVVKTNDQFSQRARRIVSTMFHNIFPRSLHVRLIGVILLSPPPLVRLNVFGSILSLSFEASSNRHDNLR